MDHSLHLSFILLGLAVSLIIWFWDSIRSHGFKLRSLVILVALVFTLLHASPLTLQMAYHHQAQDHSTQHPCCMPQTGITTISFVVPAPIPPTDRFVEALRTSNPFQAIAGINNRSPPSFV